MCPRVPTRWAVVAEEITLRHQGKMFKPVDAPFAPVLTLQEPPWSSFQGEEAGARHSV